MERKLKRAHVQQKHVRQELRDLEAAHRKGDVAPAEYESRKTELEARRSDLTETVGELVAQEEALKDDDRPRQGARAS